ncbi:MAG TPA: hypothetical protein VMV47_04990 [Bacteroidales bacterium]|nr:hypothetical protein [Bacteroidales bacterium]
MFRAKLILVVIIIISSYVYFSKPDKIVINEKGKIEGLVNKARAILQCDKFWTLQFNMANEKYQRSLSPSESLSNIMQETERKFEEINKSVYDIEKKIYTPEKQIAESLRREADRIENEGNWRMIDEMSEKNRLQTIEECKRIIPIIELRLNAAKPSYTPIFLFICVLIVALLVIIAKFRKVKSI